MQIEVPDEISSEISKNDLFLDLATGTYIGEHLTLRQAAKLAKLFSIDFLNHLKKSGVRPYFDSDDLEIEMQAVSRIVQP